MDTFIRIKEETVEAIDIQVKAFLNKPDEFNLKVLERSLGKYKAVEACLKEWQEREARLFPQGRYGQTHHQDEEVQERLLSMC